MDLNFMIFTYENRVNPLIEIDSQLTPYMKALHDLKNQ